MTHHDDSDARTSIGIDAGSSLVKLAIERPSGDLELEMFAAHDRAVLLERLNELATPLAGGAVGLTGGGAAPIQQGLSHPSTVLNEFSAWAAGSRRLHDRAGAVPPERYLLVSLGTGTSIQLVEGSEARRVAGTALGGGTVLGLGRLLTGAEGFAELCELAAAGSRRSVDLLLSDVYEGGDLPLAEHMTASSFGKLSRDASPPQAADLAAGVIHLVAENVGLMISHAAQTHAVTRVALGGSTLVGNPLLTTTLCGVLAAFGCEASVLSDGEYTGALGAIELLREPA